MVSFGCVISHPQKCCIDTRYTTREAGRFEFILNAGRKSAKLYGASVGVLVVGPEVVVAPPAQLFSDWQLCPGYQVPATKLQFDCVAKSLHTIPDRAVS